MVDFEILINNGKYSEAAKMLDEEIAKKKSDKLYYLRSIVSYKLKNYEYAREMLEHAIFMKKDPNYLKLKVLMLMETFEFAEAFETLKEVLVLKKDAETFFLSAICLMFLDDEQNSECEQKSKEYLRSAYIMDRIKTKELIKKFYFNFFKNNRFINENDKKALEEKINQIAK